ncbi:MAG: hypothetical protein RIS46_9 [Actinomycetota bacterium]
MADLDPNAMDHIVEPLPHTIVRDDFTPALISLIATAQVFGSSRIYNQLFGLGANDWKLISALSNDPGATATEVCARLGMNKSIASRSVSNLLPRKLITIDGSGPTKKLFLTKAGAEMHDKIMPIALERARILEKDLSAEEIVQLKAMLVRMLDSFETLQAFDNALIAGSTIADAIRQ